MNYPNWLLEKVGEFKVEYEKAYDRYRKATQCEKVDKKVVAKYARMINNVEHKYNAKRILSCRDMKKLQIAQVYNFYGNIYTIITNNGYSVIHEGYSNEVIDCINYIDEHGINNGRYDIRMA